MIVCICHRVSDRDIARAVHEGCATFDALQGELAVATACGACHDCAHETFHRHAQAGRRAAAASVPPTCPGAGVAMVFLHREGHQPAGA